jgi:diguanylate cyclase (GGDEF)-like protein
LVSEAQSKNQFLRVSYLNSIKTKIIVFSLLATIIPSVSMGWFSYLQNRRFLSDKIKQELKVVTSQTSRELELWLKDRLYDVRVFSSSYVVLENLEKILRAGNAHIENVVALRRLKDYLRSVQEKIVDYQELMLLDLQGKVVATSATQATTVKLPEKWRQRADLHKYTIGDAYWDGALAAGVVVITQPVRTANERLLGVLVAKINFRTIIQKLKLYTRGEIGELYLVTREGFLLVSSRPISGKFLETKLAESSTRRLFSKEAEPREYTNHQGSQVVGALKRMSTLGWGIVAEKERAKAYAQIVQLRKFTMVLVLVLLLIIGLGAYLLGMSMVRPLDRLTSGAAQVAAGDLEVDIPVLSRSEVGYLTEVFNAMVKRLRQGRETLATINETLRRKNEELHRISITDSLTGLYNRKHMLEALDKEVNRCLRHNRTFALLIIDIDHFKKYNDSYGHLAGDEVLRRLGSVFKASIRTCDYAARYGGEEFIFLLPETDAASGAQTAERIRSQVAKEEFGSDEKPIVVTVSVGVAAYPDNGDDPESVLRYADDALYKAKEYGRNQVVLAGDQRRERELAPPSSG